MAYKCVENICDKRFLCQRDLLNVPRVLLYFSSIILRTFLHLLPFLFAAVCSTKNGWQNVLWNFHNFQLETSSALCLLYLVCLNAFHLNIMSIMSIMITNMGKNGGAYILSRWDSIDLCLFMTVLYYWQNWDEKYMEILDFFIYFMLHVGTRNVEFLFLSLKEIFLPFPATYQIFLNMLNIRCDVEFYFGSSGNLGIRNRYLEQNLGLFTVLRGWYFPVESVLWFF